MILLFIITEFTKDKEIKFFTLNLFFKLFYFKTNDYFH